MLLGVRVCNVCGHVYVVCAFILVHDYATFCKILVGSDCPFLTVMQSPGCSCSFVAR